MYLTESATSSGLQNADAAIAARPARLLGLQVVGDGTNAATVVVYDNASAASGTVLAKVVVDAGLVEAHPALPIGGVCANKGIYVDVTGTGAEYIVYYCLGN